MSSPRRQHDSSKTRVKPVLDAISGEIGWLLRLLQLPAGSGTLPRQLDLTVERKQWGTPEPHFPAPKGLLRWLIQNLNVPPNPSDQRESARLRRLLIDRDPETVKRALAELEKDPSRGNWWVLEGPTYPDAVIETPDAVIVIEGKRKERKPTTRTEWMRPRHQMLRHMDGAWEQRNGRRVRGFFIVEAAGRELPRGWRSAVTDTLAAENVTGSLPHRSRSEQEAITTGFLGITTWAAVCGEFGIDFSDLPDTVADVPRWEARRRGNTAQSPTHATRPRSRILFVALRARGAGGWDAAAVGLHRPPRLATAGRVLLLRARRAAI